MEIHNLMEDLVLSMVHDAFVEEEKSGTTMSCTCHQCCLDVACYVLNRIEPEYVISGRGIAHRESAYLDSVQKRADIVSLIRQGMKKINETKRPFFSHTNEMKAPVPKGCFFNFPSIVGRVFSTDTFEPLADVSVLLLHDGRPVEMIGPNWENPYRTAVPTQGTYAFLPRPVPAGSGGLKREFEFELVFEKPGYETFRHYFSLPLVSEDSLKEYVNGRISHKIGDLTLSPGPHGD